MVVTALMVLGVLAVPVPAAYLGATNLMRRSGRYSPDLRTDRLGLAVLVVARLLGLLLMLVLSLVVLVSTVGALVQHLVLPKLVYVMFTLDLLIAVLILLTYGRGVPRSARRRGSPARR